MRFSDSEQGIDDYCIAVFIVIVIVTLIYSTISLHRINDQLTELNQRAARMEMYLEDMNRRQ